jgi:phosphoketolase
MPFDFLADPIRLESWVRLYRQRHDDADRWAAGYGRIEHELLTQARVFVMAELLRARSDQDGSIFDILHAADRVTSATMWLVVHETYARNVYLDGRALRTEDFKRTPEGHTGGALNMVPAYVGYMAANAIAGVTRSWIMGQGHTVAAIDSANLLLDNMTPAHAGRYSLTDEGLSRYVRDFYSYRLLAGGEQESPLGSHVNVHTAGGMVEGGYLGITEIVYPHMALPGDSLVVFLSDGAFEEQRGGDWAPRWWRAEDSGHVLPIMIANGRRIDQRTTMSQQGGIDWFIDHLRLNHFDPIVFDGRDPAAFAWAIFEMEGRLDAAAEAIVRGESYPAPLPHGIAVSMKGAGFYGEGTNLAHNLPLPANPSRDVEAASLFNEHARKIWVPPAELEQAVGRLKNHARTGRPPERDHSIATRKVNVETFPPIAFQPVPDARADPASWERSSPMAAVDQGFLAIVRANPHLRPRIGNPDEMRSNRMQRTLDALHFRVTAPEPGMPESIKGAVITALNEEAVAAAAVGNKGGINVIVTYEAFGQKMHGVLRQEIIWSQSAQAVGRELGWLSVPLVLTSHTWENAKNEKSHQDPSMAEGMLAESGEASRVVFAADHNTAAVAIQAVYKSHGQIWTLVVPKADPVPNLFTADEAFELLDRGAMRLEWAGHRSADGELVLTASGAYQLEQVLLASRRLAERDVSHSVVYMLEPGRFRAARSKEEAQLVASPDVVADLFPEKAPARVFVSHIRPEAMLGTLGPLHTGRRTRGLGFINQGGTMDTPGLLFVNRCSWAHVVCAAADVCGLACDSLLSGEELAALEGRASPHGPILLE